MDNVRKLWRTTLLGGVITITVIVVSIVIAGQMLEVPLNQSIFFGLSISLSSTTVVSKCFGPEDGETFYGRAMLGILVIQDVVLGLFLAILPALENPNTTKVAWALSIILSKTAIFLILSVVLGKLLIHPFVRWLRRSANNELQLLGSIAICFLFIQVSQVLIVCFTYNRSPSVWSSPSSLAVSWPVST